MGPNRISYLLFFAILLGSQSAECFVVRKTPGNNYNQRRNIHNEYMPTSLLGRTTSLHAEESGGFGGFEQEMLSPEVVSSLTIPQLKQQLRLRGLKVSGKKQDLVDRLLSISPSPSQPEDEDSNESDAPAQPMPSLDAEILSEEESKGVEEAKSKARQLAEERGAELIDVTAYLDEDDQGKTVKSSDKVKTDEARKIERQEDNAVSSDPEVWGADAKIVEDFEGRTPIVDVLSRTIIEYKGSNRTTVQAYVVASRDALKPFLAGGKNRTGAPEDRLREIQMKRETDSKRPIRFEEDEGIDEGDETGIYSEILNRDFSDWGEYTLTGAQLSAQEVQGVLFLSDVYGAFTDDAKTLSEKIAFECQPVVVMVPDLFRGNPWKEDPTTPGFNEKGQEYEEWRAQHSDLRVSVDIRAAAAVLREQYGVSSVTVWGTCYGGGRALEVAAGYLPDGQISDIDGSIGPVLVDPEVAIAWYPTRYNVKSLFGADNVVKSNANGKERNMAVMGVFGGEDFLEGATPDDAAELKSLLEVDPRVKDYMVKVFPKQGHGFAHMGLGRRHDDSDLDRFVDDEFGGAGRISMDGSDAEVACLLSTAFMETYSRVFLPTTGPPISKDELASAWSDDLAMTGVGQGQRDVRQEIEESLSNFKEEPLGGIRIDQTDEAQRDELAELLRGMEPDNVPADLKIQPDDSLELMYAKLKASDDSFQIF